MPGWLRKNETGGTIYESYRSSCLRLCQPFRDRVNPTFEDLVLADTIVVHVLHVTARIVAIHVDLANGLAALDWNM